MQNFRDRFFHCPSIIVGENLVPKNGILDLSEMMFCEEMIWVRLSETGNLSAFLSHQLNQLIGFFFHSF
jgi:hypothetical protein